MTNAKHGKVVSTNYMSSKFGEGVILDPIRTANDQGGGVNLTNCFICICGGPGSGGCGSSNKIQVNR
ncbi:hypothetical protein FOH38_14905 [Lysinibacillus fusiformis]|nr:hypothetical protein FOH38_14905 [Lysinibacillus fusiformis]